MLAFGPPAPAQTRSTAAFRQAVDRAIRRQCGVPSKLGMLVRSITVGDTLYEHRADEKRIPASNMKLLTSAAALTYLGPDYAYPTDIYAVGQFENGVVAGDLYLKGYGDPSFVQERLRELVHALKLRGVRRVTGDLVADDTFFDGEHYGRGWTTGRSLRPYLAPLGALSLNFNLVTIYVEPGNALGQPARVILDPPSASVRVIGKVRTVESGRPKLLYGRRRIKGEDVFRVSGVIPVDAERIERHFPVSDPTMFAAGAFADALSEQGIHLEGKLRTSATPPEAKLLVRQFSHPLGEIVRGLNKFSNNFIAEQILKTLGAEMAGLPGSAEKGLVVIRNYLVSLGVSSSAFELADGSGLSRLNRITPRALVRLLESVYLDFRLRPEYLASLAVMGIDGTVAKRMRRSSAVRRVRAKTGMLTGVNSLSGYAMAENGETLVFSILMNGHACRPRIFTARVAAVMTSLVRPLPSEIVRGIGRAREQLARPMPRPAVRDLWRHTGHPRIGPIIPPSEVHLGEGIAASPGEVADGPGEVRASDERELEVSPGGEEH